LDLDKNWRQLFMKTIYSKLALIILAAGLAGCTNPFAGLTGGQNSQMAGGSQQGLVGTSVDRQGNPRDVNITMTGGGEIGVRSMDADDKIKMSRALDAGTGKSTHWENGATGIGYTVTPIRKVVVRGNPFCREYSVQAVKGSNVRNVGGTACVTTDGSWHTI
jgi:surface antigen